LTQQAAEGGVDTRQLDYVHNLASRFAKVVDECADLPAIIFEAGNVATYRQLDQHSNQVARFLLERGLRRRDRVCISLEKSLLAYSVVLACIKTGITYYAVDPTSPQDRLDRILQNCPPGLVFAESGEPFGSYHENTVLCPYGQLDFCRDQPSHRLDFNLVKLADPAYIMFTSGSTGDPKGVVITHANLNKFIDWAIGEFAFTETDRHTHINPIYFDNSVFDIYSTFFSGGALVPFRVAEVRDPFRVVSRIEELSCTVFFSVPSMLIFLQTTRAIEVGSMPSLRKIIFGGEGYPVARLRELRSAIGPGTQLINVYGPTECTCICSSHLIDDADLLLCEGFPPIGGVNTYFDYYLLDGDEAVPPGTVGELCLGGPCVGHGYFNNKELSAKAFVQNPTNPDFREIIYRTGDLMRLGPEDGMLWFVGRKDFQVKHQGYRIELEEIQHSMNRISGVDESAALQIFVEGASRLVGFVASSAGVKPADVRIAAAGLLPKYMVPQTVLVLNQLPKNANGKTDRKKLLEIVEAGKSPGDIN
jgi:D-alanine--poly(phosphoribitol) ligase subunit 1